MEGIRDLSEIESDEQIVLRKAQDYGWWCRNSGLKIKDKTGAVVDFGWNEAQVIIHRWRRQVEKQNRGMLRGIILKARQEGCSTYFGLDQLHNATTQLNRECYMILQDLKPAEKLFGKTIEYGYKSLDPYFKPGQVRQTTGRKLELDTGSTLFVDSAQKKGGARSSTLHRVHATEMPEWPNPAEVITGLEDSVPDLPGTAIVFESTAQGTGDWFWHKWKQCVQRGKVPPYYPLFLPWCVLSEYERPPLPGELRREPITPVEEDVAKIIAATLAEHGIPITKERMIAKLLWRRDKIAKKGYDLFCQEYPLTWQEAFLVSGRRFFPVKALMRHRNRTINGENTITEPLARYDIRQYDQEIKGDRVQRLYRLEEDDEGPLDIWVPPQPEHRIVIPGDIATAEGDDRSAAHILNIDGAKIEQVGVWHGDISPSDFAYHLAFLGKWYGKALVAPELNNHGGQTVAKLVEIHYPRIYKHVRFDMDSGEESSIYGFPTQGNTRTPMLEQLYDYIRTFDLLLRHGETMNELEHFTIKKNGRAEAPSGAHDDLVIALAIGIYCRKLLPLRRVNVTKVPGARYR